MIKNNSDVIKYPDKIFWEITNNCNLRCKNCYNSNFSDSTIKFESTSKIISLIDDLSGNSTIGFGGGEPLMHPDFLFLIDQLDKKDIKYHFTTNGTLLNDEVIKKLANNNLTKVTVSIDGLKDYHEFLRGKNTYDISMKNIAKLIDHEVPVFVAMTITSQNYDNILPLAEICKKMGVKVVTYFRYIPDNSRLRELEHDKYTIFKTAHELLKTKNKLSDKNFQIYYEKLSHFTFLLDNTELKRTYCRSVEGLANIDYKGNYYICPYFRHNIGNIHEDSINDIITRSKNVLIENSIIPVSCSSCEYREICQGGCKGYSYKKYGDTAHKDECCFKDLL